MKRERPTDYCEGMVGSHVSDRLSGKDSRKGTFDRRPGRSQEINPEAV